MSARAFAPLFSVTYTRSPAITGPAGAGTGSARSDGPRLPSIGPAAAAVASSRSHPSRSPSTGPPAAVCRAFCASAWVIPQSPSIGSESRSGRSARPSLAPLRRSTQPAALPRLRRLWPAVALCDRSPVRHRLLSGGCRDWRSRLDVRQRGDVVDASATIFYLLQHK
jgi:hypothetical protein